MRALHRRLSLAVLCVALSAAPSRAQVATALSNYGAEDALGYTAPLRSALVAGLGTGLFSGGPFLEGDRFRARLAVRYVRVRLRDEDRTFIARGPLGTPRENPPSIGSGVLITSQQPIEATVPTLAGAGQAVVYRNEITSESAAGVVFPGGFDVDAFSWVVPQLEFGWDGYEAVLRYASLDAGTSELGQLDVFGFGLRADVTRFIDERLPVRVAMLGAYQSYDYGDGLMDGDLLTFGTEIGRSFRWAHVYTGVTFDRVDFELDYAGPEGERTTARETEARARATFGAAFDLPWVQVDAEVHYDTLFSVAFGVSLGL